MERWTSRTSFGLILGMSVAVVLAGCRPGADPSADQPPAGPTPNPAAPNIQPAPAAEAAKANIELTVTGPEKAAAGDPIILQVTVTNRGEGQAEKVLIREVLGSGLERVEWQGPSPQELARLAPGESKTAEVVVKAAEPGHVRFGAEAVEADRVLASAEHVVRVESPFSIPPESPPPPPEQKVDLGPPLVDNPDQLEPLHPNYPVWFDKAERSVVMVGQVCQRGAPLELFVCQKHSKEHESVLVVDTKAYVIQAGLIAAGAEPGTPVRFQPEFSPPTGTEIEVGVAWKDAEGKVRRARGQDWIRHIETKKPMEYPWVFAGSMMLTEEDTGKRYYWADREGDLICVSNFPSAVLDVPTRSSADSGALMFEGNEDQVPPLGTPVTITLKPKVQAE